jgi:hypothetical protein
MIDDLIGDYCNSTKIIKRISQLFYEKVYPAGTILAEEQRSIQTIYVLKEGECEVLSHQNPLKVDRNKNHF